MSEHYYPTVTGVILAGGQSRRMGGNDKGLILYKNKALISHVIHNLAPQVEKLIINANRHTAQYQQFDYPVVSDAIEGYVGPLAGMLTAMQHTDSDFILTSPCDCPHITPQLRRRLMESLLLTQSDVAVASDGQRLQPVFSLIRRSLLNNLQQFINDGGRKVDLWLSQQKKVEVDFSDQPQAFINFNRPEDIREQPDIHAPLPMLGFSAFSGTGKTTLLTKLIPALNERGIRLAVIKHAHHNFDIDKPGKDSYRIREAGAQQMLIASSRMMALIQKAKPEQADLDPSLSDLLPRLDLSELDLILIEGFKHSAFAKIELHRPSLGHPLLFKEDPHIIAIAADETIRDADTINQLDINDIPAIADFIQHFMQQWKP